MKIKFKIGDKIKAMSSSSKEIIDIRKGTKKDFEGKRFSYENELCYFMRFTEGKQTLVVWPVELVDSDHILVHEQGYWEE